MGFVPVAGATNAWITSKLAIKRREKKKRGKVLVPLKAAIEQAVLL